MHFGARACRLTSSLRAADRGVRYLPAFAYMNPSVLERLLSTRRVLVLPDISGFQQTDSDLIDAFVKRGGVSLRSARSCRWAAASNVTGSSVVAKSADSPLRGVRVSTGFGRRFNRMARARCLLQVSPRGRRQRREHSPPSTMGLRRSSPTHMARGWRSPFCHRLHRWRPGARSAAGRTGLRPSHMPDIPPLTDVIAQRSQRRGDRLNTFGPCGDDRQP